MVDSIRKARTDLALEVQESIRENEEIKGVELKEHYDEKKKLRVSKVSIKTKDGERIMNKPKGTYITIEAPLMEHADEDYHKPLSEVIEKYVKSLSHGVEGKEVLVVGLGNRQITSDSLGPSVVDHLFVTRHLIKEWGTEFQQKNKMEVLSAIAPGVMAQTGMESLEIIKGIMEQTKPELVIVIDALASRSVERLATTVQITDTGICPGSGVGNHRNALNAESLGARVVAIGVPTVVDTTTILWDMLERYADSFSEKQVQRVMENKEMENFFVTPKNIDELIGKMSFTISEALNRCFYEA